MHLACSFLVAFVGTSQSITRLQARVRQPLRAGWGGIAVPWHLVSTGLQSDCRELMAGEVTLSGIN